jgi:hypothetical protein
LRKSPIGLPFSDDWPRVDDEPWLSFRAEGVRAVQVLVHQAGRLRRQDLFENANPVLSVNGASSRSATFYEKGTSSVVSCDEFYGAVPGPSLECVALPVLLVVLRVYQLEDDLTGRHYLDYGSRANWASGSPIPARCW